MLQPSDVFLVYFVAPDSEAGERRRLVGKFMFHEGEFRVLADYVGILSHFQEGPVSESIYSSLELLADNPYYDVVSKEEILSGARLDLIPELPVESDPNGDMGSASEMFHYQHQNDPHPTLVSITSTGFVAGDRPVGSDEVNSMLMNARSGTAQISYKPGALQKAIPQVDPAQQEKFDASLASLKALVRAGQLHPDHFDTIRKELFTDEMIPSIGNKRAYNDHVSRNGQVGTHIMLDANDFKAINDDLSHQYGDKAIQHIGNALRAAVDESVGPEHTKVHRFGGDEFHVHTDTPESAHVILRTFRDKLEAIAPIGGTHKLSVSAGIGADIDSAEHALTHGAKIQKKSDVEAAAVIAGKDLSKPGHGIRSPKSLYVQSAIPGQEDPLTQESSSPIPAGVLPAPPADPSHK